MGAMVYAKVIDKNNRFKRAIFIFQVVTIVFFELTGFILGLKSTWLSVVAIGIYGFHLVACLPLYLELACEIAFPVS